MDHRSDLFINWIADVVRLGLQLLAPLFSFGPVGCVVSVLGPCHVGHGFCIMGLGFDLLMFGLFSGLETTTVIVCLCFAWNDHASMDG